jgi:membrane-associated phospholipid phosphatase
MLASQSRLHLPVVPIWRVAPLAGSRFAAEWYAILATVLVDAVWAAHIDFRLVLSWQSAILPGLMLASLILARTLQLVRFALLMEYLCLSLAGTFTLLVLSYLAMASAGAPVDSSLEAADHAMGFDWLTLYRLLLPHPGLMSVMQALYNSILIQGIYCAVLLSLMGRFAEMRALWRLTFTASVICCLAAMFLPALGPFQQFALQSHGEFLPVMKHLLSKRDLVFTPSQLTGVICFPSLHTVLALAYPYGVRRIRPIFWLLVAVNFLMLFTIPFFGGHYLSDMIAGAGVMLVAVIIVRYLARPSGEHAISPMNPAAQKA